LDSTAAQGLTFLGSGAAAKPAWTHDLGPLLPSVEQARGKKRKQQSRGERGILKELVNNSTVRLAPEVPVKDLGNILSRLLQFMQEVPVEEEIHFAKMDLANGYWHIIVERSSCWNFDYVLPAPPGTPVQLVIPSALQMGWNKGPAYFCATTKTTGDVAQAWIDCDKPLPVHTMEPHTAPDPRQQTSPGDDLQMSAIYVDNFIFILAAVESAQGIMLLQAI
jgi:hypothetical protein